MRMRLTNLSRQAQGREAAASLNQRVFAILDRIADPAIMDQLQAEEIR